MFFATTPTLTPPESPAGRMTFSTLLRGSAAPPATERPPESTLPLYVVPPAVTTRSRSFTNESPVVGPGGSVQASVTRSGFVEELTL